MQDPAPVRGLPVELDRQVEVAHRHGPIGAPPLLHDHGQGRSQERPPERPELLLAQLPERFGTLPDCGGGLARFQAGRPGSRPRRIAEHVEEGDRLIPQELEGFGELLLPLPWKSHDHVGPDADRPSSHDPVEDRGVLLAGVASPHRAQDPVRPALERQMEVPAETRLGSDHLDDPRPQLVRLDGGEAHAVVRPEREQRHREPRQSFPLPEILAVAPQVRAREHDLREPGLEKPPRTFEHLRARKAPAPPPHVGHDAVRAEGVAAVLDLEERARPAHVEGSLGREVAGGAGRPDPEEGCAHAFTRGRSRTRRGPAVPADRANQPVRIVAIRGAEDRRDSGNRPHLFRRPLRVASRDHDSGSGRFAVELPDELPCFLIGAARHRARVHEEHVRGSLLRPRLDHSLGQKPRAKSRRVVLVQPAAQSAKRNPRGPGRPLGRCRDRLLHLTSRTLPARRSPPRLPAGRFPLPRARPRIPPKEPA